MKSRRTLLFLLLSLLLFTVGLSRLPTPAVGLIHSRPDEKGVFAFASGVYIGDGMIVTNWHVLKTLRSRQEYFQLPLWNEHIYNFDLPVDWVIFTEQSIDLALAKLPDSHLSRFNVDSPCLSVDSLLTGEALTITSSPLGRYPPVTVRAAVTDPTIQPRMNEEPAVKENKRYAAISFVATVEHGQEDLVTTGSSGGAVLNADGELVGLVWATHDLPDGTREVWVTPASAWVELIRDAEIAEKYKSAFLGKACDD